MESKSTKSLIPLSTSSSSDQTIWRLNENYKWILYCNNSEKLPPLVDDSNTSNKNDKNNQNTKAKDKKEANTPFYFAKIKNETKGSLVYTPKGYGIIQNIKMDQGIVTVKVNNEVVDFTRNQVLNEIPISLYFITNAGRREDKILLPIHSTVKDLIEKIETEQDNEVSLASRVFYQGKELNKSTETLEKLNIIPFTKFLITASLGKYLTVTRFTHNYEGWGYSSSSVDGISFSPSKDIRVIGFGIYVPNNGSVAAGNAKFLQGGSSNGQILFQKELAISKNMENSDDKIYRFLFNRPFRVKNGEIFSCVVELRNCNTYYGSSGIAVANGEQDITFSFKDCSGSNNGTGIGSGQIPEIYYYLQYGMLFHSFLLLFHLHLLLYQSLSKAHKN